MTNFNTSRPIAHSSLNLYGSNHHTSGLVLSPAANNSTASPLENDRISNVPRATLQAGNFLKTLKNDYKLSLNLSHIHVQAVNTKKKALASLSPKHTLKKKPQQQHF